MALNARGMSGLCVSLAVAGVWIGLVSSTPAMSRPGAMMCPAGTYRHVGVGFEGCAPIPGYNDAPGESGPPPSIADIAADVYARGYYQSPDYYRMMNLLMDDPIPPGMEGAQSQAQASAPPPRLDIPEGSRLLHQTSRGVWVLFHNSPHPGQGCAATFSQGGEMLILSGPHGPRPGTITFMGPQIPKPAEARETRIVLKAAGRPAEVRAIHLGAGDQGVLIVPTIIEDTLPSIGDSESLSVDLDGQEVYAIQTEAAFQARDALKGCLAGRG